MADPNWNNGDYYFHDRPETGLAVARMIGHVTYLSDESMRLKFGRRLQDKNDFSFSFNPEFQVENYLRHQGRQFVERFDANAFCTSPRRPTTSTWPNSTATVPR